MKLIKINILAALAFGCMAIILPGCSKDDGGIRKSVKIDAVPAVTTNLDATGSQAIDMLNLSSFSGKFKVDLYFPGSTPPTKVDIVVRKSNGATSSVKTFKTDVTTFPTSYTISVADLQTLFGAPVALGDNYDFAPDIYVGTTKYEAFSSVSGVTATNTGITSMPFFSEFARFSAICAYDPAIYEGNFVVVSDAFGDFSPGEVVTFTKIDATHFSFKDPYVTSPLPIIVTINTANNQASITKQKIGNAFTWNLAYTNPNAAAAGGTTSFVSPCDKAISLNITYTVDQGSFGSFVLKLKKP